MSLAGALATGVWTVPKKLVPLASVQSSFCGHSARASLHCTAKEKRDLVKLLLYISASHCTRFVHRSACCILCTAAVAHLRVASSAV